MDAVPQIVVYQTRIDEFCRRNQVKRLSLFGSVLREDFNSESDIDILVEFEPDAAISLFEMGSMQMELTEILGRMVDLKTAGYLSRLFRHDIIDQVIYGRA